MALILEGDESEAHKEVTRKRGREVYDFTRSSTHRRGIDITAITSIPRWHMARALFSENKEESAPSGIGHAIRACLADTGFLLAGRCHLVDYAMRDFADFERPVCRLSGLRALLRTAVYILNISLRVGEYVVLYSGKFRYSTPRGFAEHNAHPH